MLRIGIRFGLAGIANSLFGFAIIMAGLQIGLGDYLANAAGYLAGFTLSYFLNRNFVFGQNSKRDSAEIFRFSLAILLSYLANLVILSVGRDIGYNGTALLQLAAMAVYTAIFFLTCQLYVFQKDSSAIKSGHIPVVTAIMTMTAFLLLPGIPNNNDVTWQYWIARQLVGGSRLYEQINEVNPPLWFWVAIPIQMIGNWIDYAPLRLNIAVIILLTAGTALITDKMLPYRDVASRLIFTATAFSLSLIIAIFNFGQREHIAMVLFLPYALLIARRVEGREVCRRDAILVAIWAAPGIALKHYFAAAPIFLELWLMWELRKGWSPFRNEIAVMGIAASLYACAIFILTPEFFSVQLPMIMAAYAGYDVPFLYLLDERPQSLWLVIIAILILYRFPLRQSEYKLYPALLLSAAGFLLSYFAQKKGWPYHAMPVSYFMLMALLAATLGSGTGLSAFRKYPAALLAFATCAGFAAMDGTYRNPFSRITEQMMAKVEPESTLYILTADGQKSWPMMEKRSFKWPSRFFSLWMVPAISASLGDRKELARLSNDIRKMTIEDLRCNPPDYIAVDKVPNNYFMRKQSFDFRNYFLAHPDGKEFWEHYSLYGETKFYDIYQRTKPVSAPERVQCRVIY